MRNIARLLPLAIVLILASCKSADDKAPQIASDYCNCFADTEKKLSKKTIDIMTKASNATDPQAVLKEELISLEPEEQKAIGKEMMSLGKVEDENSELGHCIKAVEKKYGKVYTLNQVKFAEKIVRELETKSGCTVTAAIMRLGLKNKKKN